MRNATNHISAAGNNTNHELSVSQSLWKINPNMNTNRKALRLKKTTQLTIHFRE